MTRTLTVKLLKIPEPKSKGDEIIAFALLDLMVVSIEKYNRTHRWEISGYAEFEDGKIPFGEVFICDKCNTVYLLEEADFVETDEGLICEKCQKLGESRK